MILMEKLSSIKGKNEKKSFNLKSRTAPKLASDEVNDFVEKFFKKYMVGRQQWYIDIALLINLDE